MCNPYRHLALPTAEVMMAVCLHILAFQYLWTILLILMDSEQKINCSMRETVK